MTALALARSELEEYVRQLVSKPTERLNLAKLRWLEGQIERAAMALEAGAPF